MMEERIDNLIYEIRDAQVMLDSDLTALFDVETKVFNQAVKRNINRFPFGFRFQLSELEYAVIKDIENKSENKALRSQFVTFNNKANNNDGWTIYKLKSKVDTSKMITQPSLNTDIQNNKTRKVDSLSKRKVDTSSRKVDTSKNNTTRLSKSDLEKLIMKICMDDYIKMDEVAKQIGKSVDYLKNKIFPTMIKEGKLEKHFPYTHNHPEQGYKTNEEYEEEL